MEEALRYELIKAIPELKDKIFATNAPPGIKDHCLVYARINTKRLKTLEGYTNKQELSYMFSIMATRYGEMKKLTKKVEELLVSLPGTTIGNFYVEDIDINNVTEMFEYELQVNRGIIDFTIYFEEVE